MAVSDMLRSETRQQTLVVESNKWYHRRSHKNRPVPLIQDGGDANDGDTAADRRGGCDVGC